jgi:hypothetical protein
MTTPSRSEQNKDKDKEGKGENLEDRIRQLEVALEAAQAAAPMTTLPANSAGPGKKIAETWSMAEQEAANRS